MTPSKKQTLIKSVGPGELIGDGPYVHLYEQHYFYGENYQMQCHICLFKINEAWINAGHNVHQTLCSERGRVYLGYENG